MGYEITRRDRIRWKVKETVKHANYTVWKGAEWLCRKALFLGRDTSMDWLEPVEGKPYSVVNSDKLRESIDNSYMRFHGQPRREYYMDKVLRFIFLDWYVSIFKFKRRIEHKFEWWLFFHAREWTWEPWHYISRNGNDHIDGHVTAKVWGFKVGRTLDVCALSGITNDTLGCEDDEIQYHDLNKYGSWGFPTLMVLQDKIMAEDIDKLLRQWYNDAVEYKYRHWTWKGDKPKINIGELKFMEDPCEKCGLDAWNCRGHYREED